MPAGIYNFKIEQGSTFERILTVRQKNGAPVDLTGYTAEGQMREKADSQGIAAVFTMTFLEPRTEGKLKISLAASATAMLPARVYAYDLELGIDGRVERLLQGKAVVSAEVTR